MTNEELVEQYQNGKEEAFNELLEQNKGIIHYMKYRWFLNVKNGKVTEGELENECVFGFWLAVKNFKIDSDLLFSTCAFNRIQWHLGRILIKKISKTATGEEVNVVSFDDVVPGTDNLTYEDMIQDEGAEQLLERLFNDYDQQSLHDDLIQLLDELLSDKEKQIILMHYGIDCKPCSQVDIGKHLSLTDSRVGQIEADAFKKIHSSPITAYFADKYNRTVKEGSKQIKKEEHRQKLQKNIKANQETVSAALNFFGI